MELSGYKNLLSSQGACASSQAQRTQALKTTSAKPLQNLWENNLQANTASDIDMEALLDIGDASKAKKANTAAKKIAEKRAKKIKQRAKKNGENIDVKVDGDKLIQTIKDKKGNITNIVTKQYNAKGKVVNKTNEVYENGVAAKTVDIKYDKNGKKQSKLVSGKTDGVETQVEVKYTKGALPSEKIITKGSGTNKQVTNIEYAYDERNLLEKKVKTLPDGNVRTTDYGNYLSVAADGEIQRTAKVLIVDKNGKEVQKFDETQRLNNNNQIINTERTDKDGNVIGRTESFYDENFNLTKHTVVRFYTAESGKKMGSLSTYSNYEYLAAGNKYDIKTELYDLTVENGSEIIQTTENKGIAYFDGSVDNDLLNKKTGAKVV